MLLRPKGASRSFAGMRVEAVDEIPERQGGESVAVDAAASLAMKNFATALESDDSLFALLEPPTGATAEGAPRGRVLSGDIALSFKQADLGKRRQLLFLVVEKLLELLKEAGSKEFLEARLCLTGGSGKPGENALRIRLAGKGETTDQAMLRWGLGLAHLQQALLFTSRHLRQHLAQGRD